MDYFTADPHLGHRGTLSENNCNRPFSTLEEMDNTIISNINKLVRPNDTLYILGDFSFRCSLERIIHYRNLIKCKHLVLVAGNHDLRYIKKKDFIELFDRIETILFYKGFKVEITLCHYAMLTWPKRHRGAYHLFGHSHGKLESNDAKSFDVGVDCWNFRPLSILEIIDIFEKRRQ